MEEDRANPARLGTEYILSPLIMPRKVWPVILEPTCSHALNHDALRLEHARLVFSFSLQHMAELSYQSLTVLINSALQHWPHSQWGMYAPPQIDPLMLSVFQSFNGAVVDHDERVSCGRIAHS